MEDPDSGPSGWFPGLLTQTTRLCWSSRHLQCMVCHAYTGPQQTRMLAVLYELPPLPPFRCTVSPYAHVLADFLCSVFQLKGLDQLLGHFPDILHSTFAQGTERRVVDRLNQCLSPLLRGHPHRPSRGCRMQAISVLFSCSVPFCWVWASLRFPYVPSIGTFYWPRACVWALATGVFFVPRWQFCPRTFFVEEHWPWGLLLVAA